MILFFRFTLYFSVSFLILCVPINGDPLFSHLHQIILPEMKVLFRFMGEETKKGLRKGKVVGEKFFNSQPPQVEKDQNENHNEDIVTSKNSAIKKSNELNNNEIEEEYSAEERAMLEKVFRNK